MVRQAEAECGPFEVCEIDISQQPDAIQQYGVVTTPSLVINGRLAFSGIPKARKLMRHLKNIQRQTS